MVLIYQIQTSKSRNFALSNFSRLNEVTMERNKIEKAFKLGFCMFCVLLTTFMSVKLVLRYHKNKDSSSFSYRTFHETPTDTYPVFTICFENSKNEIKGPRIYNTNYLNGYGLNGSEIENLLSGINLDKTKLSELYSLNYNDAIIKFHQIATEYFIDTLDCKVTWDSLDKNNENTNDHCCEQRCPVAEPMIKSYQDPTKVCFTRNNKYGPQRVRTHEKLMRRGGLHVPGPRAARGQA